MKHIILYGSQSIAVDKEVEAPVVAAIDGINKVLFIPKEVGTVSIIADDDFINYSVDAGQPNNEIWYTSNTSSAESPKSTNVFGANIISNTYDPVATEGNGVITFDGDVTSIGDSAFSTQSWLTSISIPKSVTSIGNGAFISCICLSTIIIPSNVISIGNMGLGLCTNLTSVTCLAATPPTLGQNVFMNDNKLTSIYVPASSVDAYKSAWSTYSSKIQAIPE